jgi:hypothetical protein
MRSLTLAFVLLFGFTLTVSAQSDDWYSVPGTQPANPNNVRRAAPQPTPEPVPIVDPSTRAESPFGAKFYIAPMPEGFDGMVAAQMISKKLPVTVVADERAADFIITGGTGKGVHKWYDTVCTGYERDRGQGTIRVVRVRDRTIVWAGDAGDRSLWWGPLKRGGQRKVADRLVGKMKSHLFKKAKQI